MQNAQLLRQGHLSEIDVEHIAEELESMGKSERRELMGRLSVLMSHLLKWLFQPELRSNSWKYTIEEQRSAVTDLLEDSPSLRHELEDRLAKAYTNAVLQAARETGLAKARFPEQCPFSLDQIRDDDFWPN
ncbi:DUF29 domain-containing protein [Candidatus Poribacteria bacterium]|nr:DUF29 domain-containing protein [Candidatus Poribacteria bacterium]